MVPRDDVRTDMSRARQTRTHEAHRAKGRAAPPSSLRFSSRTHALAQLKPRRVTDAISTRDDVHALSASIPSWRRLHARPGVCCCPLQPFTLTRPGLLVGCNLSFRTLTERINEENTQRCRWGPQSQVFLSGDLRARAWAIARTTERHAHHAGVCLRGIGG